MTQDKQFPQSELNKQGKPYPSALLARMIIRTTEEQRKKIQTFAANNNISLNQLVNDAIKSTATSAPVILMQETERIEYKTMIRIPQEEMLKLKLRAVYENTNVSRLILSATLHYIDQHENGN
ncbi:MAG: hypothetical protein MR209_00600 [Veillonellaceae bacterium]|nr:hypothetical protein [Veillonellaceae bacterium]